MNRLDRFEHETMSLEWLCEGETEMHLKRFREVLPHILADFWDFIGEEGRFTGWGGDPGNPDQVIDGYLGKAQ